jgi:hypothetical protein
MFASWREEREYDLKLTVAQEGWRKAALSSNLYARDHPGDAVSSSCTASRSNLHGDKVPSSPGGASRVTAMRDLKRLRLRVRLPSQYAA